MIEQQPLNQDSEHINHKSDSSRRVAEISLKASGISVNLNNLTPDERKSERQLKADFNAAIVGYLEAVNVKSNIRKYTKYLDSRELDYIHSLQTSENNQITKNNELMWMRDQYEWRYSNNILPIVDCEAQQLADFCECLKTEYIMNFNESIKNCINNQKSSECKTIGEFQNKIKTAFYDATGINNPYAEFDIRQRFDGDESLRSMFFVIEGMRHEEGFKELFCDIDEIDFDPDSYNKKDDAKGIDLRLNIKLSKTLDHDGKFVLASKNEIKHDKYIVKELPVDIKSTKINAENELNRQLSSGKPIDHWVIWSHIYKDDFRLGIDDGRPEIIYEKVQDSPVFLKYDEQIAAIKALGGKYANVRYSNKDTGSFYPDDYETRVEKLKTEVLTGINRLYATEK